jgi:hypothetical protein
MYVINTSGWKTSTLRHLLFVMLPGVDWYFVTDVSVLPVLKMGRTGCPETPVNNYSTNIHPVTSQKSECPKPSCDKDFETC